MNNWNNKKNISKIKRIFPYLNNDKLYNKILIDHESFNYITKKEVSEDITKIICFHLINLGVNPLKIKLVDYTSGVGGNVLSFSNYFKEVIAIEISNVRASYLLNNINVYKLKNVIVLNECSVKFNETQLVDYAPNVIFIDVPWGDDWNKKIINHRVEFGGVPFEKFVSMMIDKIFIMYDKNLVFNNYNNRLIILKLPKNYDIKHLYEYTKCSSDKYKIDVNLYVLEKMCIIIYEFKTIL